MASSNNGGDLPDPGVAVTARLPPGVTLAADNSAYDADSGVWSVGTLAPHATASLILSIRANSSRLIQQLPPGHLGLPPGGVISGVGLFGLGLVLLLVLMVRRRSS